MATRFYFQPSSPPAVNPPIDAGWNSAATMLRRIMTTGKDPVTESTFGTVADGQNTLALQLVSPPLAAQTFTGTVTIVSRVRELEATDNINKRARSVRVYSADGTTLRATLTPFAQTSSATEFLTSNAGQIHAQNNGVGTVTVQDGDIIVVEIGYGISGTTGDGNSQYGIEWGGTGTDHAVSNNDQSGTVPFVEFSANLIFAPSQVTLTPATVTSSAQFLPAAPGMVTVSLTPATAILAGRTVTATPGAVTAALTPATATRTAVAVTPVPLSTGVILTPATATTGAVAVTAEPGMVTTSTLPALLDLFVLAVTPVPLAPNVDLTPGAATLTAPATTPAPGVVVLALTPATATLAAQAAADLQLGVTEMTLTPATTPVAAVELVATPGQVTMTLTAAEATVAAQQTTPAGVGVSSMTLTRATATLTGVTVTAKPGLVVTPLTVAGATFAGASVTATPGLVTTTLSHATATAAGVTVTSVPGPVTMALTPASASWSGTAITPTPGPVSTFTLFATGTWTALPVEPAPVEGILLQPAVVTAAARKTTPVGRVLPLNTYELPMARVLLDSLREVLENRTLNPPQHFSLRVGQEVPWDMSEDQDLCCEGLAYVKINRVYPSTNFPFEDQEIMPCGPLGWAADLEMGILRCAPVGTVSEMPTDAEWTDAADLIHNDAAAMRMALDAFAQRINPLSDWQLTRQWLPLGPMGACTGGSQIVTVGWIPC